MADSNHTRRDDFMELSENDPFAELTRIMGHDPRETQPAAPVQGEAAATPADGDLDFDFDLDLERELAADLDFSDYEEPASELEPEPEMQQVSWQVQEEQAEASVVAAQPVEPAIPAEPTSHEQASPEWGELDAEFDNFFAASTTAAEPEPVETYQSELPAEATDQGYEGLGDALEQELLADDALWAEPEPEIAPEPEPVYAEPAYDAPVYQAEPAYAPEANYEPEPAYEVDSTFPEEPASAPAEAQTEATEDGWAAEAEFDVDFLERELAAVTASAMPETTAQPEFEPDYEAMTPPPASFEAEPFVEVDPVEKTFEEPTDQPLSLEEELKLLLADKPLPEPAAQPFVAATSSGFGRANFAAATPAPVTAPAYVPAFVPAAAELPQAPVEVPVFNPIETPAQTYQPPVEDETSAPEEVTAADSFDDIFGDDFALDLDEEIATEQPIAASAPDLPDIETIDVAETVPRLTDDLDIPEIDYGAKAAPAPAFHDDFQSDFDHLFGDVTAAEAGKTVAASVTASAADSSQQGQYDDLLDNMQWQTEQTQTAQADSSAGYGADSSYAYETDLEQAIAMSAYEDQSTQPASRRRGLLVAAGVGGLIVLGGLGVFGASMFGGGSDSPAIVRADPDPMKVRPENPGGTTVPNQDNEVYQRVSGAGAEATPQQEQLITSAEEPVDVVARTITPQEPVNPLVPGVEDEGTDAGQVKSEDRIEQAPQGTSPVEAEETAVVTPRRVRTMVVRPDGTMVPREEIVAAPTAPVETAPAEQPVTAGEATALAPMGETAQPTDELDGPVVDMPQTVSVVPTQRSRALQSAAATPQPVVAQQPTAAPVAAPTAASAASEWSMQIASQPTAEGAQASYQDLARRYGSVLEGRGVSIVRADIDGRGTYYRVRIPASNRDEAIQLCTRYKAVGGSCFVSR